MYGRDRKHTLAENAEMQIASGPQKIGKAELDRESVTKSNGKLATFKVNVITAIATFPGNI